MYGDCPGHELRIKHHHTSDTVVIEERREGEQTWNSSEVFDDGRWCAILEAHDQEVKAREQADTARRASPKS